MSSSDLHEISESAAGMRQDSLYEIRNVQQIRGELNRRWFFSHEMDLIVWFDEDDKPISFQLSYDKQRNERAIRWKPAYGYSHHEVEDNRSGARAGSALLTPAGAFDAPRVRSRFLALSAAVPWAITQYVADRLLAHPEHRSRIDIGKALELAVLLAMPIALIFACLKSLRDGGRRRHR